MIGRTSTVKNSENFSEQNAKILPANTFPLPRNRQKKRNYFSQLWRQWLCLLKSKPV